MTEVLREDTSARRKIIEAAREVFVDPGYAAATIKQLAAAAGVSVQSVYFVFGNKPSVLSALLDVAVAGDEEKTATLDRPWVAAALGAPHPLGQLRIQVHHGRLILERTADILLALRAAASADEDAARLWQNQPHSETHGAGTSDGRHRRKSANRRPRNSRERRTHAAQIPRPTQTSWSARVGPANSTKNGWSTPLPPPSAWTEPSNPGSSWDYLVGLSSMCRGLFHRRSVRSWRTARVIVSVVPSEQRLADRRAHQRGVGVHELLDRAPARNSVHDGPALH